MSAETQILGGAALQRCDERFQINAGFSSEALESDFPADFLVVDGVRFASSSFFSDASPKTHLMISVLPNRSPLNSDTLATSTPWLAIST